MTKDTNDTAHSPLLPWECTIQTYSNMKNNEKALKAEILDCNNSRIVSTDIIEDFSLFEHIVKCVNSHDVLLDILDKARNKLRDMWNENTASESGCLDIAHDIEIALEEMNFWK